MLKSALADFNDTFSECSRALCLGSTAQMLFHSRDIDYGVSWLIKHLQEVRKQQNVVPVLVDNICGTAFQNRILRMSAKLHVVGPKFDFVMVNVYDIYAHDENETVQVVDCLKSTEPQARLSATRALEHDLFQAAFAWYCHRIGDRPGGPN